MAPFDTNVGLAAALAQIHDHFAEDGRRLLHQEVAARRLSCGARVNDMEERKSVLPVGVGVTMPEPAVRMPSLRQGLIVRSRVAKPVLQHDHPVRPLIDS